MLKGSNKLKKVILAILSIVAILGIATTASKIANNQKAKIMPASTHVTGQYDLVQPGDENLPETPNVQFDAYFLNDSVKTRGALLGPINGPKLTSVPTKELYMEVKVLSEGYLKNGRIEFTTTNSKFVANLVPDNIINGQYIGNVNSIELKKIDNGTIRVVRGEVHPNVEDKDYLYRTDNKVKLTGIYVDNQGRGTPISKTVNYAVENLYGELTAVDVSESYYPNPQFYYTAGEIPKLNFSIRYNTFLYNQLDKNTQLFGKLNRTFKTNEYKIKDVPKFNNYQAESIEASYTSRYGAIIRVPSEFNKEKNTFSIINNDSDLMGKNIEIKIIYPKESGATAVTETLTINGEFQETWHNSNSTETKSNLLKDIKYATIRGARISNEPYRHSYIDIINAPKGENVYSRYEGAKNLPRYQEYKVRWSPYEENSTSTFVELTELQSRKGDRLDSKEAGKNGVELSNYVEYTGISFRYNLDKLQENSSIEIYDNDTGELINTFNRDNIIQYNGDNKYEYSRGIKNIKVVIKNIPIDKPYNINITHYKRIDDERLAKDTEINKIPNRADIWSSMNQKTEKNSYMWDNDHTTYIYRDEPTVTFSLPLNRSKSIEQAEYYGEDTSITENLVTYSMKVNFSNVGKEVRIQDKFGFLMEDNTEVDKNKQGLDFIKYQGIYFGGTYLSQYDKERIPDDIYVKVYNQETGELIKTFNKEEIIKHYFITTAYLYDTKLNRIMIDTNHNIDIINILNIDQKELVKHFEKSDYLNNKKFLINNPQYSRIVENGLEYKDFKQATTSSKMYSAKVGATAQVSEPISTYNTRNMVTQKINLTSHLNVEGQLRGIDRGWKKGIILIEYPKDIKEVEVYSTGTSNQSEITILGHEKFEKNGIKYLKIFIDATRMHEGGTINLLTNLVADPFSTESNVTAKVYYYNNIHFEYENSTSDIEDINLNGDTNEKIGITEMPIKIIGPDTLIVRQQLTDFNTKGDIINSPLVGTIESNGTGKARVNIILANRWAPSVSNIKVFGRIPYKGNKTPVTNQDLNSTFTAGLTGPIILPDEFKNKARVYYSEEDKESTIDINDTSYNWKEYTEGNPNNINWNNVKHFYIDLVDIKFEAKDTKIIKYDVNIPINAPVNVQSYATVAATFNLNTLKDGDIVSKSEADKVGVQLVKKYDLTINSLIKGNKNPIENTIYKIENKKTGSQKTSRTIMTSNEGIATTQNLTVNEEYRLTEESINSDYKTERTEVDFKVINQLDGTLALEIQKSGNIGDTKIIQPTETSAGNAVINMEYLQNIH